VSPEAARRTYIEVTFISGKRTRSLIMACRGRVLALARAVTNISIGDGSDYVRHITSRASVLTGQKTAISSFAWLTQSTHDVPSFRSTGCAVGLRCLCQSTNPPTPKTVRPCLNKFAPGLNGLMTCVYLC
jgi:hypothetical protein